MTGLASWLFDLALRIGPADRHVWFRAMQAELEVMPGRERLRFASGCVAAALVWRIWTPDGVRAAAQAGLVAASASLAMLVTVLALRGSFGPLGPAMIGLGGVYGAGALATAVWGLRGMCAFALAGIALNAMVMTSWVGGIVESSRFVRALSLEACLILGTFLGVAALAHVVARRLERGR